MQTLAPHQLAFVLGGNSPNMEVGPGGGAARQPRPQSFTNSGGRTPGSGGSPNTLRTPGGGATPAGGGGGGGGTRDTGFIGV